jgi:hypothetical protein
VYVAQKYSTKCFLKVIMLHLETALGEFASGEFASGSITRSIVAGEELK